MGDQTWLHDWHHDDYDLAKGHIFKQLGDYTGELEVFGRQVLIAVYVRPLMNPRTGMHFTDTQQKEDIFQGKVGLVLALGPDAFKGDDDYVAATFGPKGAPEVGDWVFTNPNAGMSLNIIGKGGERVTEKDRRDEDVNLYPIAGWACRVVPDEQFIGRVLNPHNVV
jgi:hypothetical protein